MLALENLNVMDWVTSPWVQAPAALVLWVAAFLVVRRVVMGTLRRMAARTSWTWDDVLVGALTTPFLIAILASGLLVFERILPLDADWDRAANVLIAFSVSLALVLFIDRLSSGVLDRLSASSPILRGARGLIQGGVRGVIIAIGLLIFLDSIGISITPILASLGVGSLAVALALQDTLANLFAGVYMIADKPIEPGQMIRLPTGEEGTVAKVGWRSTWIRLPQNNMLIIPNVKLAGGTIVNYDLPQSEIAIIVPVGVHYGSDLDRVQQVTLEVAREAQRKAGPGSPSTEPALNFLAFGENAIQFNVVLRARDFPAGGVLRHEFVKRLQERYRKEGIIIPYPTRTLDIPPGLTDPLPKLPRRGDGETGASP